MMVNNVKETILIVDDEPKNLGVVSDFLKAEGYRIASANSGELAIERAKAILPDLILLDITMPGMGGLKACEELKKQIQTHSIPVIFMTALAEVEDKVRGFKAGAVDYITKPIQKEELLVRVNTHLKLYRYSVDLEHEVMIKSNEIQESRKLLASTIDTMPSVIIGVTIDKTINLWNSEAVKISGITAAEAIGKPFFSVLASIPINLAEYKTALMCLEELEIPLINTPNSSTYEYSKLTSYSINRVGENDDIVDVGTSSGESGGVIIRIDDITEQHTLQETLHHSQKMQAIGELASGVAHDFNNQLAGILGGAELLTMQLEGKPDLIELVEIIQNSVTRSSDLTKKLLSFARKGKLVFDVIEIVPILNEVKSLLTHGINKNVTVTVQSDSERYKILGDSSQIQNALLNLGINARDAIEGKGEIVYSLEMAHFAVSSHGLKPGDYLHVEIRDDGDGIPPEIRERIFTPFFTTKGEGKGTGMGLAAVKGTVESHNGVITLESELGIGTVFHMYLPVTDHIKEVTNQAHSTKQSGSISILCIDDDPLLCILYKKLLERLGHSVTTANSGAKGVGLYKDTKFDLVILDMIMPNIDGAATFKLLKAIDPDVNVVIASGYTDSYVSQSLYDLGVENMLLKPFKISDLEEVINVYFS